jgi:hypothetical protein
MEDAITAADITHAPLALFNFTVAMLPYFSVFDP